MVLVPTQFVARLVNTRVHQLRNFGMGIKNLKIVSIKSGVHQKIVLQK
jgi:hypothetical protein